GSERSWANLSPASRAAWKTALFLLEPNEQSLLQELSTEPIAALWQSIDLVRGPDHDEYAQIVLTANQRDCLIRVIGRSFPNVDHPSGWSGRNNPWDATEFVANQIDQLATSTEA